jgi:cytochrome c-type biogenesis protein CcmH/NrfF
VKRLVALLVCGLALASAAPALASEEQPTLAELESEVYCPTCKTLLSLSNALVAERMRDFIRDRIAAGETKSEIKDALVAEFGEAVLAAPPKEGFNLLAWVLPFLGVAVAGGAIAVLAVRWRRASRTREDEAGDLAPEQPLAPDVERRLDEEIARFDL